MAKNKMTKQELLDRKDELVAEYGKVQEKSAKKPILTKKQKKVLGIGKDIGKAQVNNIRIAPRKVAVVCNQVRGKDVNEAKALLLYTNKVAAPVVLKLINSAVANAVNNNNLDADQLYVADLIVGPGPIMKRWRAAGKGSARPINKRTCQIKAVVRERA